MVTFSYLNKAEKDIWLPRLFDLLYENMKEVAPTGLDHAQEKAQFISNVSPALEKEPRQVLLAVDDGALVGYIQFYTRDHLLMVEEVQIRRDHQGTMLFLRLCRKLLKDLPENIRTVEAYADRRNHRSICLMKRLGMSELAEDDPQFIHLRGDNQVIRARFRAHS